jgi:GNAT superfamily N-acetyltransferase
MRVPPTSSVGICYLTYNKLMRKHESTTDFVGGNLLPPLRREMNYPFADLDLARRLERTESLSNAGFVDARAKAFPDVGAEWIEVGGAYAMFDGANSPVTQTFGLGMFEPLTPENLDKLETFFSERGADTFHEVCPLADPSTFALLAERGYKPIEFSNVLYQPISAELRLDAPQNEQIRVRLTGDDEMDLWADTVFAGWSEFTEVADFLRDLGQVQARSKALSFLAELDGKAIAGGVLAINGDVALLAGASTIPRARRQGAQLALLEARLRYAATQGCTVGMMVTQPGSGSQRNSERHGFRIAYTRTKWQLQRGNKQDAGI